MRLSLTDVLAATRGAAVGLDPGAAFQGVSTDTRTLRSGNLFVALAGPRFDGHDHLATAAERGAAAAVVRAGHGKPRPLPTIEVADTLVALGDLARHVRRTLGLQVLAITGSVGKTTVKEFAAALVRGTGRRALVTPGNWNNRVGLPLTLLGAAGDETVAILELGISEPGEMAHLTRIAEPDVALITTVAACHTEGLGSLTNVAAEKRSIENSVRSGGVLVVPEDDPLLASAPTRSDLRRVSFGWAEGATLEGHGLESLGLAGSRFRVGVQTVQVALPGRHNAANALAAIAGVSALGLPWEPGTTELAKMRPPPLRGEVRALANGARILVDCYNANPRAVIAALETLASLAQGGRTVAVLGEMRELGAESVPGHRAVGEAAARLGVDELHLLGAQTESVREGACGCGMSGERIWLYQDVEGLSAALGRRLRPGDWVLIKGSRALGLEQAAERLERTLSDSWPAPGTPELDPIHRKARFAGRPD